VEKISGKKGWEAVYTTNRQNSEGQRLYSTLFTGGGKESKGRREEGGRSREKGEVIKPK